MALSGLNDVDWRALWVGDDQDSRPLPSLLLQMATSGSPTARGAVASVRTIVLADQPSEVAIHVAPFLARAIELNADPLLRRETVELLHDLALGGSRRLFPESGPPPAPAAVFEGEPGIRQRDQWALEGHSTVELLLPALLPLLEEVDDALVSSVIALVASFRGAMSLSTPPLWKLAREEGDSALGGQALIALARLGAEGVSVAARVMTDEHSGSALAFWPAAADLLASARPSPVAIHHVVALSEKQSAARCPFMGTARKLQRRLLSFVPRDSFGVALNALSADASLLARTSGLQLLVRWAAGCSGEERRAGLRLLLKHGRWSDAQFVRLLEEYELPATHHALSQTLSA